MIWLLLITRDCQQLEVDLFIRIYVQIIWNISYERLESCTLTESANNQKLMLEYEKFQEMQSKMMKMQEEYDLKLAEKEESKMKDMERQTEYYETKLREKISQLEQVCHSITRPNYGRKCHRFFIKR